MEASGFRFEVVCIGWSHPAFLGILMWETNYCMCWFTRLQQIFFILDEKVNIVEPQQQQQQKKFWFMI